MQNRFGLLFKVALLIVLAFFNSFSLAEESSVKILPANIQESQPPTAPLAQQNPAAAIVPTPPELKARSYILVDANSGYVIAEKNAKERFAPASLTKLMTLYIAAQALRDGRVHLDDSIIVSEKAWRTGGSRMFIRVGSSVTLKDLIRGSAIASGNDATVAIAEHLAGTEVAFVDLMNQTAGSLSMNDTSYADSVGFGHDKNYSTAYDLAILSRAWIKNFPKYYPWFKEKWITYNGIKQPNRNRLLWHDPSVDGIKTGHTDEAGYCLISSAKRKDMRLIVVIMGAKNDAVRTRQSKALLNYGFRFFETHRLFTAGTSVNTPKVLFGKNNKAKLGLQNDLYVTVPIGQYKNLKASVSIKDGLRAPIVKDDVYGDLNVTLDGKILVTQPLVALEDNPKANFFFRIFDYIKMLF